MKTATAKPATWWKDSCHKARAALTDQWESVPELTKRTGHSGLVFASLHLSGMAERRMDASRACIAIPAAHIYYRRPSLL